MRYKSTRGGISGLTFCETLLMGLAPDGGLLLPESIPNISSKVDSWRALSFVELAQEVIAVFADDIPKHDLDAIIKQSYSSFELEDVVGL